MKASIFKIFLTGIVLLVIIQACKKGSKAIEVPDCINAKIEAIKAQPVWNQPGSVWQYEYNGQIVYYIPAHCCDIPSVLFDANCNAICSPSGGISGAGSGTCTDFYEKRKNEKLIWKDPRNYH